MQAIQTEPQAGSDRRLAAGLTREQLFWLFLAFHAASALAWALITGFPNSFDELQHLSYVRWEELHPSLLPHFEQMRVLSPDLSNWQGRNYLTHPAPYYLVMAGVDSIFHSIIALRLANILISCAAVALILRVGFRCLEDVGQQAIFGGVLILFPKLAMLAGIINNDNAALLAAAVFFYALVRWREERVGWPMAIALALCGWTKLTAFVMAAFAFGIFELLTRRKPERAHLLPAVGIAVGLIPSLVNLTRYKEATYDAKTFYVPLAERTHLDLLAVSREFLINMAGRWPVMEGALDWRSTSLFLILALAAVACVRGYKVWPIATALVLATIPSLGLHFWLTWKHYQANGSIGSQIRYYYALWPGFALALAHLWNERAPARLQSVAFIATASSLIIVSTPVTLVLLLITGHNLTV